MKLIKRAIRAYRRIDRLTGRIRDVTIKGVVQIVKAYRKANGTRVRAHRRNRIAADLRAAGKPVVRRSKKGRRVVTVSRQGNYMRGGQAGTRRTRV